MTLPTRVSYDDATDTDLDQTINDLSKQLDQVNSARREFEQQAKALSEQLNLARSTQQKRRLAEADFDQMLTMWTNEPLAYPQPYRTVVEAAENYLREKSPSGLMRLHTSSTDGSSCRHYPMLTPPAGVDGTVLATELEGVLEHWGKVMDYDDEVCLSVMSDDLSEHGVVHLNVNWKTHEATITVTCYGRTSIQAQGTLADMLDLLSKEHSYGQ